MTMEDIDALHLVRSMHDPIPNRDQKCRARHRRLDRRPIFSEKSGDSQAQRYSSHERAIMSASRTAFRSGLAGIPRSNNGDFHDSPVCPASRSLASNPMLINSFPAFARHSNRNQTFEDDLKERMRHRDTADKVWRRSQPRWLPLRQRSLLIFSQDRPR